MTNDKKQITYKYYWCDVFTEEKFGGNPLVVFPDARGVSTQQMQKIAKEFNLSETVFVLPPENPQNFCRLRIFTPNNELPFAGHPTVGTAYVLAAIGQIPLENEVTKIIFEEGVGDIPITIFSQDKKPFYTQLTAAKLPEIGSAPPSIDILANLLSLEITDFLQADDYPQAISCGVPFLFIPLVNRDALKRAKLNQEIWQKFLAEYWAPHIYIFTYETELSDSHIRARMFAPALGIVEDAATGSAATALAGYLGFRNSFQEGILKWQIEQGFFMGRPSILQVEADKKAGKITQIRVGGASVLFSQGNIYL